MYLGIILEEIVEAPCIFVARAGLIFQRGLPCEKLLVRIQHVRLIPPVRDHHRALDVSHEHAGEMGCAASDERRVVGGHHHYGRVRVNPPSSGLSGPATIKTCRVWRGQTLAVFAIQLDSTHHSHWIPTKMTNSLRWACHARHLTQCHVAQCENHPWARLLNYSIQIRAAMLDCFSFPRRTVEEVITRVTSNYIRKCELFPAE